jgi:hypothetical protein
VLDFTSPYLFICGHIGLYIPFGLHNMDDKHPKVVKEEANEVKEVTSFISITLLATNGAV